jgi:hypothetical protein
MIGRGGPRTETYTVPEGFRAVVRNTAICMWNDGAGAIVSMHGIDVLYFVAQGSRAFDYRDCRFTLYERETIRVLTFGQDVSYAIDGYLLLDSDGTPDDANNVIEPYSLARPTPRPTA